ncbi:insertion element IS1106 transposase (fragment) [Neisseria mucosa]
MKPQTVQIVRQGEATPYWFKFNPLYFIAGQNFDLWQEYVKKREIV